MVQPIQLYFSLSARGAGAVRGSAAPASWPSPPRREGVPDPVEMVNDKKQVQTRDDRDQVRQLDEAFLPRRR